MMGLNVAKGNMYSWITHTWNTVKGKCPHDCVYCYMKRFGEQKPVRFDVKELNTDLGSGNSIFIGSSCDMFAGTIPTEWIAKTIAHASHFDNLYVFQSKNPASFPLVRQYEMAERPMAAVFCTTLETNRWYPEIMHEAPRPEDRAAAMNNLTVIRRYKYVTIEPIMDFDLGPLVDLVRRCEPYQVNIGADSGGNHLHEPSREKVLDLIKEIERFSKVEKKQNLNRILRCQNPIPS